MAVKHKLQCPRCAHKFYALSLFPDCCPHCAYEYDPEPGDNVISMPTIRTVAGSMLDKVYRAEEAASEKRAEQAAEMAGVPVSEMSGLKITNMRDNMREGDIAAMPVQNEVTRQMDRMTAAGMPIGFQAGINTGGGSGAGAQVLGAIQRKNMGMT